jgi:hypothetical protein
MTKEYQRGYAAGRKKGKEDFAEEMGRVLGELELVKKAKADERRERVFMQCLEMTLKHCSNWQIGGQAVDNAEKHCKLAGIFAKHSISEMTNGE